MKRKLLHLFIITLLSCLFYLPGLAQEKSSSIETTDKTAAAVSTPGNENVGVQDQSPAITSKKKQRFISKWLHMIDRDDANKAENSSVIAYGLQVPGDLVRIFKSAGGERGLLGFFGVLLKSFAAIGLGFLLVLALKRLYRDRLGQLKQLKPPNDDKLSLFWVSVIRHIPTLAALLLLTIFSTLIFLLLAGGISTEGRMVFQSMIGAILIIVMCSVISRIIFSPEDSSTRLFETNELLVKPLYFALYASSAALLSGFLIANLVNELGGYPQTIAWVVVLLGTTIIGFNGYLVLYLKKPIADSLQKVAKEQNKGWIQEQLSTYWHVPALLYLFVVWFIWIGQEMTGTTERNGSFVISMLIVPIYFALSYAGKSLIMAIVESLGLGKKIDPEDDQEEENQEELTERREKIAEKTHTVFRVLLIAALAAWVLSLWGYRIPYATQAIKAIFQSIITLAFALVCWRFVSSFIQKKIEEATPEVSEEDKDDDDEFGGAAPRGRSHTLLPMLRKVVGTFLAVMVILIVLSSLGVNIGPLLAGAGVFGLAIGFGAQKLVSDVLSGFFFLLDDAFRVGEYIQAGKVRGTVEAITLRNVMLRHHLGMLQVVPHSDLGAITNYMRGGIVIKFPLEFPYDTDIDKVRKIIKKVGVAMLADEELGDDFLQPVKSQGVYEITNSVMVIRAKFTAKPGKQFVIKREAFRRITEALNAKGIYYAHRKVIVDFPDENHGGGPVDDQMKQKAIQAGAAAVLAAEAEQQKQAETKEE